MQTIAYYPGSFDPITSGHLDVLAQAMAVFERVVVGIGVHAGKKPMFTFEERAAMIEEAVAGLSKEGRSRIGVESFDNLAVEAARKAGAGVIVRGLRDATDLDFEMRMAGMNGAMAPRIKTVFFPASPHCRAITGTLVRQIVGMGGDVTPFVPPNVVAALLSKTGK